MKSSFSIAAGVALLATAATAQQYTGPPACAVQCLNDVGPTGCTYNDGYSCLCSNRNGAIDRASTCINQSSCNQQDKDNTFRSMAQICMNNGVQLSTPPFNNFNNLQPGADVGWGPWGPDNGPGGPWGGNGNGNGPLPTPAPGQNGNGQGVVTITSTYYNNGQPFVYTTTSTYYGNGNGGNGYNPNGVSTALVTRPTTIYSNGQTYTALTTAWTTYGIGGGNNGGNGQNCYDPNGQYNPTRPGCNNNNGNGNGGYGNGGQGGGQGGGYFPQGPFGNQGGFGNLPQNGAWTSGAWTSWWNGYQCPSSAWSGWTTGQWSTNAPWTSWTACTARTTASRVITTTSNGQVFQTTSYGIDVAQAQQTGRTQFGAAGKENVKKGLVVGAAAVVGAAVLAV
ncbi:hypothetical protein K402DRAFT_459116 [Aulographum hederae CBS 113979]|uniref:CFEM domain-containing protein n=1 Tax=Aulographum hederae CBS 113979 TaxID=1176131 RepID=A0A6G1HFQ5_9PEZI|nr:hypothetical protein K402DRAFT_459116 [Aulographum hederae CBS 113979]